MYDTDTTVGLSASVAAFPVAPSVTVGPPAPGVRRLLVVEDDPATRRALGRLFRQEGWDVLSAATMSEGLALLGPRIDCAILDLNLPDGDGASVLRAIRESRLPTRVVVASATADAEHLARVARLGPDLLLQKPVEVETLLRACVPAA